MDCILTSRLKSNFQVVNWYTRYTIYMMAVVFQKN